MEFREIIRGEPRCKIKATLDQPELYVPGGGVKVYQSGYLNKGGEVLGAACSYDLIQSTIPSVTTAAVRGKNSALGLLLKG